MPPVALAPHHAFLVPHAGAAMGPPAACLRAQHVHRCAPSPSRPLCTGGCRTQHTMRPARARVWPLAASPCRRHARGVVSVRLCRRDLRQGADEDRALLLGCALCMQAVPLYAGAAALLGPHRTAPAAACWACWPSESLGPRRPRLRPALPPPPPRRPLAHERWHDRRGRRGLGEQRLPAGGALRHTHLVQGRLGLDRAAGDARLSPLVPHDSRING
jgi:hypothetical protein